MRRRAVFLDVDGTLANHAGVVPDTARGAVQRARANGHLVFLCTGRSLAELWPELVDIGFDGVVACAGAYVEAGDEVLVHHHVDPADLERVRSFFDGLGVHHYFQANDGIYGTRRLRAHLQRVIADAFPDADERAELTGGLFRFVDAIDVDADPIAKRVTKVIYLDAVVPLADLRAEFAGTFDIVPSSVPMFGPHAGEMMLPGIHKAAGIDAVLDHLGLDPADTIALGDSHNDLEMLERVAVGIAMGNAPQAVLAVADDVTATPDEHGVHLAFLRHGLLDG